MLLIHEIIFAIIVFIHSRLCYELTSRILNKSKYHFFQYPFCLINATILLFVLHYIKELTSLHYVLLVLLLFSQIRVLFKSRILTTITITTGLILHLFVFRCITVSLFSLMHNQQIVDTISSPFLFYVTSIIAFILHIIAILFFNKFVPPRYLKIIEENAELLLYISIICIVLVSYLIFNANIYSLDSAARGIQVQQIVLPTMILLLFYIALLMLFNIIKLHAYKHKATELEDTINKEKRLKSALFNMTKIFVEFSCTRDELIRFVRHEKDVDISLYNSYSDFMHKTAQRFMHPDDIYKSQEIEAKNIINLLKKGQNEVTYEYRTPVYQESSKLPTKFIWHKLLMQSKIDPETNEVTAFFLVYEIHDQKEAQLSLQAKAERDTLTGGYNKTTAQSYIDSHLQTISQGTFFMIDLDNFKSINDNFGHTYGDNVLCELYNKIKAHFRAHDIIARVGGDEFIVFATDNLTHKIIDEKASDICKEVKHTYTHSSGKEITVSASIGISLAPKDGLTFFELFNKADNAMYQSKNKGKSTHTFYS